MLKYSKHNKNADAERMLTELEGRQDTPTAPKGTGAGAQAARRALIREDRAQRLTVQVMTRHHTVIAWSSHSTYIVITQSSQQSSQQS